MIPDPLSFIVDPQSSIFHPGFPENRRASPKNKRNFWGGGFSGESPSGFPLASLNDLRMGERERLHFDLGINLRLDVFFLLRGDG